MFRRRVRPYQALDLLVVALGIATLVGGACRAGVPTDHPLGSGLIAIPIVMLVSVFPLVLLRPGGDVEIGFDAAVLVALGVVLPHAQALVIWSIAGILSQVLSSKRHLGSACSTPALVVLVGGLTLVTMSRVGGLGHTSAHELLAVLAGAAMYFTADWLITGLSLSLESGEPWHRLLFDRDLPVSLVWFLGISFIGYLAVLLPRSLPHVDALAADRPDRRHARRRPCGAPGERAPGAPVRVAGRGQELAARGQPRPRCSTA